MPSLIATITSSVSSGAVIAIILLLALIVLSVSLWLNRRGRVVVVKRCPNCDTVMRPDVQFCPNCGKEIPIVTTLKHDIPTSR